MTRLHTHEQGRTFTRLGLAVVALVFACVGVLGTAGSAIAAEVSTSSQAMAVSTLKTADAGSALDGAVCANAKAKEGATDLLPVYRWSDATGNFHTRYSAVDLTNVPDRVVSTAFTGTGFALGNAMWQLTTNLVQIATRACPLESAGGLVDNYAGKLATTIMSSGIVTGLVVISILGIAFRGLRTGGANWKALWPKIAAIGLFAVLMTGALASTGGGANGDNGPYKPGLGSPGYFAVTIDRTISSLTALPVAALAGDPSFGIDGAGVASGTPTNTLNDFANSCPRYVKALNELYTETYGTGKTEQMVASTPKALSAMWEVSGLRSWRKAQFGTKNYSGSHMYCYGLEKAIDVPVSSVGSTGDDSKFAGGTISDVTDQMKIGKANPDSLIWQRTSNNDVIDQQLVMLAECRLKSGGIDKSGTFSIRHLGNEDKTKFDTDKWQQLCKAVFGQTASGISADDLTSAFDWPPRERKNSILAGIGSVIPGGGSAGDNLKAATIGTSTIDKYAKDDGARDFLRSLHGDASGTSLVLTIAYVISSFTVLLAFGLISVAILVAKIMALVLIFMIFFVILGMLLPNSDNNKLIGFVKQYAGLSFFIFGFQLILAILVLLTKVLIQIGNDAFANDFANMLWVGFSPVLALVAMHIMFKKMGLPSPLSVNAGASWGKAAAAGAIGGAAGGAIGAGLMSRAKSGAKDIGKSALGNAIGNGKGKGQGGDSAESKGRSGKLKPDTKAGPNAKGLEGNQADGVDVEGNPISATPEGATATAREKADDVKQSAGDKIAHAKEAAAARKEQKEHNGALGRPGQSVSKAFANVGSNLRHKPIRTLAKAGIAAGAVGVMGPGVLLGAGLYMGAKKGISSVGTTAGMDTASNRDALARSAERRDVVKQADLVATENQRATEALQQQEIETQSRTDALQRQEIEVQSRADAHQVTMGKAHDEAHRMEGDFVRQQEQSAWESNGFGSNPLVDSAPTVSAFTTAATHQQLKPIRD